MVEAGGQEIDEETMYSAIIFGFEECKNIVAFQEEAVAKFGKTKNEPVLYKADEEVEKEVKSFAFDMIKEAMYIMDKDERNAQLDKVKEKYQKSFQKNMKTKGQI